MLEVSAGTGRNIKYYDLGPGGRVASLTITDANKEMLQARRAVHEWRRQEPASCRH